MEAMSNRYKPKELIAPNMTYLITSLGNKRKPAVNTEVNIHRLYNYLQMIGNPTKLTTLG